MKKKALKIVEIAQDHKAIDPVVLDLRKVSNFCDFFVVLTGTSHPHIRAIADGIKAGLKKQGIRNIHLEGYRQSRWIVLDYASVIVHIFDEESRYYYDLEHLWADAKVVKLKKQGT